MKRTLFIAVPVFLVAFVLGGWAGHARATRQAEQGWAYSSLAEPLNQIAIAQLSLSMLHEQRLAPLQSQLEARLVSAIHVLYVALQTRPLPQPMPAMPNLIEAVRRAGLYLHERNPNSRGASEAEWVYSKIRTTL